MRRQRPLGDFPGADPSRDQREAATPNPERLYWIRYAILAGLSIDEIHALTSIDHWFLANIEELIALESRLRQFQSAERPGTARPGSEAERFL